MSEILIVDDDKSLLDSFERLLIEEGYTVRTASSGETAIAAVADRAPDLVIMDVRLPGISGMDAFGNIREADARLPVIIMTAFGTTETAIEATKQGAFDYILKPFDIPEMLELITQALEAGRVMRSRVRMNAVPGSFETDALIGKSEAMQAVYKAIGRVAATDATVLVRGESGTGKELVARAIYQHSSRAQKPFLVINCVAIPETLLESELFGYEKGAFTGAAGRRVGKIEQANGGTVFLDEIGDMPLPVQAKILRLLQERSIERLGGYSPLPVDVRIIAATNRNLERAIEENMFRDDLYYRLKVVTIELPPLGERKADIPLLCDYFLAMYAHEMKMDNPGISREAVRLFEAYDWPGNVRELGNVIKKALIFSRGYPIRPEAVSQALSSGGRPHAADTVPDGRPDMAATVRQWVHETLSAGSHPDMFNFMMDHFGGIIIGEALQMTDGNRSRAAKLLGLTRPTLQSKIEKYRLSFETRVKE